jgi:SAM-dependent methyltransferase
MKLDQHYMEPRLVELYDLENPCGADTKFYIQLAADLHARVIVDLGCGTGLLTRELAIAGRQVIGVDPALAMLAYARRQPGAERVQWFEGDASVLGNRNADLVVMTGNVAQVFLEDSEWDTTLRAIHKALKTGGYLAFESRNPDDKAWERWNRENTFQRMDSPYGPIESWLELVNVGNGKVSFKGYNVFTNSGEEVIVDSELRFRSQMELTDSLKNVGFAIENVYGDWERGPVRNSSRAMVFMARCQ